MFEAHRTATEVIYVKVAECGDNETVSDGWSHDLSKDDIDQAVMAGLDAFRAKLDEFYKSVYSGNPRDIEDHVITNLNEWQRVSRTADINGRFYAATFYTAPLEPVIQDDEIIGWDEGALEAEGVEPLLSRRVEVILDICNAAAVRAAQDCIDQAVIDYEHALSAEAE